MADDKKTKGAGDKAKGAEKGTAKPQAKAIALVPSRQALRRPASWAAAG